MHRRTFTLLPLVGLASVGAAASPRRLVVVVELVPPARSADWIAAEIAAPFERALCKLAGLVGMHSMSSASRCSIELGYAGGPTPDELAAASTVAVAAWRALTVSVPEPSVVVREARLT